LCSNYFFKKIIHTLEKKLYRYTYWRFFTQQKKSNYKYN